MRKASREMNSDWALEIMRKAPYITQLMAFPYRWPARKTIFGIFTARSRVTSLTPLPLIPRYASPR